MLAYPLNVDVAAVVALCERALTDLCRVSASESTVVQYWDELP